MGKLLKSFWGRYKSAFLYAFWLPLFWILLLVVELTMMMDLPREKLSLPVRLFEDLVFVMSFLFYSARGIAGYLERPMYQASLAFFSQFFFWWVCSFFSILLYQKLSGKK